MLTCIKHEHSATRAESGHPSHTDEEFRAGLHRYIVFYQPLSIHICIQDFTDNTFGHGMMMSKLLLQLLWYHSRLCLQSNTGLVALTCGPSQQGTAQRLGGGNISFFQMLRLRHQKLDYSIRVQSVGLGKQRCFPLSQWKAPYATQNQPTLAQQKIELRPSTP